MTDSPHLTDALAPFRAYFLPGRHHEELAEQILDWLLRYCTCARGATRHAMDAYVASTYELYCAPADATPDEYLLGAQYVAVTLLADDAYDGAPDLNGLERYLRTGEVADDGELLSCYRSITTTMRERGRSPAGFEAAVLDTLEGRLRERRADPDTIGWAEHWSIRRHTIAVAPYVWCHRVARGLQLSAGAEAAVRAERLLELVSEAVARGNDIASYLKESEPDPDDPVALNSVLHYARDLGSLQAGIDAAVPAYRESVRAFETATANVAATWPIPPVQDYLAVLRAVLAGNLRAIRRLSAQRYPGTLPLLDELAHVPASPTA